MTNPISLAFLTEAFLILAALAYLLGKWGVARLSWRWFLFPLARREHGVRAPGGAPLGEAREVRTPAREGGVESPP